MSFPSNPTPVFRDVAFRSGGAFPLHHRFLVRCVGFALLLRCPIFLLVQTSSAVVPPDRRLQGTVRLVLDPFLWVVGLLPISVASFHAGELAAVPPPVL